MGFLGDDADTNKRKQENSDIRLNVVIKICNGGRIPYILTNFFPNIFALNSKCFTC